MSVSPPGSCSITPAASLDPKDRASHRISYRARARTRARNRIEATVKEYLLGCDRLGVYRTQIQAVADCRDAEYDMSAR